MRRMRNLNLMKQRLYMDKINAIENGKQQIMSKKNKKYMHCRCKKYEYSNYRMKNKVFHRYSSNKKNRYMYSRL